MKRLVCDRYLKDAAQANGTHLGAVALHLKIKSYYKNPTIYNLNYKKHAELFGVSESSLRRYVAKLIEIGVGHWNNANFQLKGTDAIMREYKTKRISHIDIAKTDSINTIKDKIRLHVIAENQVEQKHLNQRKTKNPMANQFRLNETLNDKIHLSLQGVGALLGLSKTGAQCFIERTKKNNLVSSKMVYIAVAHVKSDFNIVQFRQTHNIGYFFVKANILYRHLGQEYFSPISA